MNDQETTGEKLERLRALLSYEQRTFCEQYLLTLDPVDSYQKAFNCKRKSANHGYVLLEKWYIKEYLSALMEVENPTDALLTKAECLVTLREIMRDPSTRPGTKVRAVEVALRAIGVDVDNERPRIQQIFVGFSEEQLAKIRSQLLGFDETEKVSVSDRIDLRALADGSEEAG